MALLEAIWQDVRYALRTMRRSPAFTSIAILSLALGIGANTAIFTLVNAVMLRMLPVRDPQQLVELLHRFPQAGEPRMNGFSWREYRVLADQKNLFSTVIACSLQHFHASLNGSQAEPVDGGYAAGNFFEALGLKPSIGRLIGAPEDRAGSSSAVAVLSWPYWKAKYSLSPVVVGKRIVVENVPVTIIGVAPRDFYGLRVGYREDLWIPMALMPVIRGAAATGSPRDRPLCLIARLQPGVKIEQARAETIPLLQRTILQEAREMNNPFLRKLEFYVEPAGSGLSFLRDQFGAPLLALMAAVGLLLLIACGNIASMLLARATARQREIAVRLSLGAGRLRLVGQMLTEALLLSFSGAVAGVFLAYLATAVLAPMMASGLAFAARDQFSHIEFQVRPDVRVLLFTAAVALVTGVLFGLAPALRAWGSAPAGSLRDAGAAGESRWGRRFGKSLVAAQVALSVVLLTAAAVFFTHLANLRGASLGFRRDHVLLVTVDATHSGSTPERLPGAYRNLVERLDAIPGVQSATVTGVSPIRGEGAGAAVTVEGYESKPNENRNVSMNWIGPRYFETLGTPLLEGRDFMPRDEGGARVAIVNRTMARYYFGDRDALGRHITLDNGRTYEIAGVAADAKYSDVHEPMVRTLYLDAFQDWKAPRNFALRTRIHPESLVRDVTRAVADELPATRIVRVTTLADQIDSTIIPERLLAMLSGFFGALGLAIAAIGLYGLLAYTVARRVTEIGVRMALGANRRDVIGMVLLDALGMVSAGLAMGGVLAFWARTLVGAIFKNQAAGAGPVLWAGCVIIGAALLAAYVPARRAAGLDPMSALRYE